jgi:SAM-dependent methyltransferase
MKKECEKGYELCVAAHALRIYYARAMDGTDATKIRDDECSLMTALQRKGLPEESFVNPHTSQAVPIEEADRLVDDNLKLLKASHIVLANLSLQNYTYVGAIFEMAQAANLGRPIVACIGSSSLDNRYYLHRYCDFICRTIDEAVEYIRRCWTLEGINHQLNEEREFYDKIAIERGIATGKPYKNKELDIDRYKREKDHLKEKLRDYCRDKIVLELGCGTGEWTQVVADVAKSVTCIESSRNMIERAKQRLAKSLIQPNIIHGDFFDETSSVEPADVILSYFTLSFLPPKAQSSLLSLMKKRASRNAKFLFGESIQISTLPSIGLGHQRIQTRGACGKEYMIYKEHFTPYRLERILTANGFRVADSSDDGRWFTFCAAQKIQSQTEIDENSSV